MKQDIEFAKTAYYKMLLIRRFEERAAYLYTMKSIGGFCHLYIGQEAVVVGAILASKPEDTHITSYRDHGHMLACDMDPRMVMSELTGKSSGYSKGKGGSMHMFSKEKNFYGGHGIVGAQVSIGTGIAFALKYNKTSGVSFIYMGDGAMQQGQVYESFNMSKLWNLPALYIIENNGYSMGTSVTRCSSVNDLYLRGSGFNIPSEMVDGMDFFAVYKAINKALEYIRSGNGPCIIEMKTYRYKGHSMSDPGLYRTKDEIEQVKVNRDPIEALKNTLKESVEESWFKKVDSEIKSLMKEVEVFAETSPEPDARELYTDILI
jgi:pyruvate dehydrogenase E1 component alpha subunit